MALRTFFTVFGFCVFVFNSFVSVSSTKNNSNFTPTHEWKTIEEGQAIPGGLHVRINLSTGKKEAKLPDLENNKKNSLIVTENGNKEVQNSKTLDPQELKTLLKNIKAESGYSEDVKRKFRSYEKLKEDFSEIQLQVKTDIEILKGLIDNFRKLIIVKSKNENSIEWNEDEILTVLVDLEYLVHQFDNAQEFAKLNGFPDVIYASLNSTNGEIRSEALRLLGSATQSNPKVQITALESGAIHSLLKILTFDEDINVRARSLFALSCLIRRFPAAQQKLITDGGLTAFAKIFDKDKEEFMKLQVKIITLIHDLLFERKDTKMNILEEETRNQTDSKVDILKERLQQYEKMDLEKKLVEQEWCKRISDWFMKQNHLKNLNSNSNSDIALENVNLDSHDVIEKVVDTLYVLSDICKTQFQKDTLFQDLLLKLKNVYSQLALDESKKKGEDDSNQFYTSLSNILNLLIEKIKEKPEKDEL